MVNERAANRYFGGLDEMEEALVERCLKLSESPGLIRSHTLYFWWPPRLEEAHTVQP